MNDHIHKPVLADEVLHYLSPKPSQAYLDLTAGYGGHAGLVWQAITPLGKMTLVDRDQHDVVEDAGRREVHVDDLRQRLLDERQEDALAREADVVVLHRRDADDGGVVDRLLPVRDAREVEDGKVIGE